MVEKNTCYKNNKGCRLPDMIYQHKNESLLVNFRNFNNFAAIKYMYTQTQLLEDLTTGMNFPNNKGHQKQYM